MSEDSEYLADIITLLKHVKKLVGSGKGRDLEGDKEFQRRVSGILDGDFLFGSPDEQAAGNFLRPLLPVLKHTSENHPQLLGPMMDVMLDPLERGNDISFTKRLSEAGRRMNEFHAENCTDAGSSFLSRMAKKSARAR